MSHLFRGSAVRAFASGMRPDDIAVMIVHGEYRIPAEREQVWRALRDPEVLLACIPGCQQIRRLSDTEFEGRVTAEVGAVAAAFTGRMVLSAEDFPGSYSVSAHAASPLAGYADGEANITLSAGERATILGYRARIEPGGRLATVGGRLLHGVATRFANEFFSRLIERLSPAAEAHQDLAGPVGPSAPQPPLRPPIEAIAPAPPPVAPRRRESVAREVPEPAEFRAEGSGRVLAVGTAIYVLIFLMLFWPGG